MDRMSEAGLRGTVRPMSLTSLGSDSSPCGGSFAQTDSESQRPQISFAPIHFRPWGLTTCWAPPCLPQQRGGRREDVRKCSAFLPCGSEERRARLKTSSRGVNQWQPCLWWAKDKQGDLPGLRILLCEPSQRSFCSCRVGHLFSERN